MDASFALPPRMPEPSDSLWSRLCYTSLKDTLRGNVAGQLDARRAIAAFELGEKLSAVVWQMVEKTRLWRSEKVDVARELASHFREGLDAGVSEEELVEQFGDRVTAVKLIRRAKIRGRGWAYFVWTRGWQGILALSLLLYVAQIPLAHYYYAGKPTIRHNYWAEFETQIESLPMADRAWPLYREALSVMQRDPEESSRTDAIYDSRVPIFKLGPEVKDWQTIQAFVAKNQAAVLLTRQGSQKKWMGFTINDPANIAWFASADAALQDDYNNYKRQVLDNATPFSRYRGSGAGWGMERLRKLIYLDAAVARAEKDSHRLTADLECLWRLEVHRTNTLQDASEGVYEMQSQAVESMLANVLCNQPEMLANDDLLRLAKLLNGYNWRHSSFHHFAGNENALEDYLQRNYTDDGKEEGHVTDLGMRTNYGRISHVPAAPTWRDFVPIDHRTLNPIQSLFVAGRKEMKALGEEIMQQGAAVDELAPWERKESEEALSDLFKKLEQHRYRPLKGVIVVGSPEEHSAKHSARFFEGVGIGVALERYKREHGEWPKTLEAMVPEYLAEVPVDWLNGKPLRYVFRNGKPLVYSVGPNTADDEGGFVFSVDQEYLANAGKALESYKRDKGEWPSSLLALVPDYVDELPQNGPNGQVFDYELTDKGPIIKFVRFNPKDEVEFGWSPGMGKLITPDDWPIWPLIHECPRTESR